MCQAYERGVACLDPNPSFIEPANIGAGGQQLDIPGAQHLGVCASAGIIGTKIMETNIKALHEYAVRNCIAGVAFILAEMGLDGEKGVYSAGKGAGDFAIT